jgi:hypothetical protein
LGSGGIRTAAVYHLFVDVDLNEPFSLVACCHVIYAVFAMPKLQNRSYFSNDSFFYIKW